MTLRSPMESLYSQYLYRQHGTIFDFSFKFWVYITPWFLHKTKSIYLNTSAALNSLLAWNKNYHFKNYLSIYIYIYIYMYIYIVSQLTRFLIHNFINSPWLILFLGMYFLCNSFLVSCNWKSNIQMRILAMGSLCPPPTSTVHCNFFPTCLHHTVMLYKVTWTQQRKLHFRHISS